METTKLDREWSPEEIRAELARLKIEHDALKTRLIDFQDRLYLTPDEQVTFRDLQKLKLKAKDQMAMLKRLLRRD